MARVSKSNEKLSRLQNCYRPIGQILYRTELDATNGEVRVLQMDKIVFVDD